MRFAPRKNSQSGRAPSVSRRAQSAALLILLPLVWLFPPTQLAQPRAPEAARPSQRVATLASYRERVRRAAASLEELAGLYERAAAAESEAEESETDEFETDESGADGEAEPEAADVLSEARDQLPPRERVGRGGDFVEVDNTWLHEALDQAEGADDNSKRAAGLRAAAARLRSLEARLSEAEVAGAGALDRDAERGRLNAILSAPEFDRGAQQQPQGNALQNLIRDIIDWILSLLPKGSSVSPGASPRASALTQVVVFGLCLAVLLYVARWLWLRRGRGRKSPGRKREARVVLGERLEADQTASDLLEDAERLARGGDLRGAIRKAYVALLCELGDRGVVRLAQHKTNRDYLNAVRRAAGPGLYAQMLPLTFDFEVHWYGLRDATASDWESFKTRCRNALSSQ